MAISEEQVNDWFSHHPPEDADQMAKYAAVRQAGRGLALEILRQTPPSADQTAAIRKVREAVMTANAAIALKGR